ncbi:MAG TPA: PH domain-containing protein [Pyrinomonadaceae bacterium]|nr:PH domain-containing protein [Pyrinomonadaceae bacterium]
MFCGNCGADVPAHLRFCTTCGAPTDNEETRVATEETRVAQPRGTEQRTDIARADWPAPNNLPQASPRPALARTDDEDEHVIFTVRPTFMFVGIGYIIAALSAILLTVLLALYVRQMPVIYALPVALLFLLIPAWKHLKRNALKYTLTDSKIEIDQGLISRRTRNIPLRNVQDVTVSASLPQRLLGFGNVIIDNAGDLGDTTMHNIPKPRRHAELILRELRRWH